MMNLWVSMMALGLVSAFPRDTVIASGPEIEAEWQKTVDRTTKLINDVSTDAWRLAQDGLDQATKTVNLGPITVPMPPLVAYVDVPAFPDLRNAMTPIGEEAESIAQSYAIILATQELVSGHVRIGHQYFQELTRAKHMFDRNNEQTLNTHADELAGLKSITAINRIHTDLEQFAGGGRSVKACGAVAAQWAPLLAPTRAAYDIKVANCALYQAHADSSAAIYCPTHTAAQVGTSGSPGYVAAIAADNCIYDTTKKACKEDATSTGYDATHAAACKAVSTLAGRCALAAEVRVAPAAAVAAGDCAWTPGAMTCRPIDTNVASTTCTTRTSQKTCLADTASCNWIYVSTDPDSRINLFSLTNEATAHTEDVTLVKELKEDGTEKLADIATLLAEFVAWTAAARKTEASMV